MRHSIKLLMCSALIGIVGGCSKAIPKPRLGAPFALSEAHLQAIKLGAAKDLKDPYSAMLERVQATRDPGGVITVCGFINGKNSFGAYVGAKPFVGGLEDYTDSKTKKATRVGFRTETVTKNGVAKTVRVRYAKKSGEKI